MKKIMFNDRYGLTQAVLECRKTQTRRICHEQIWSHSDIINAENGIFHFEIPKYNIGKVIAVAQSYRDCGGLNEAGVPRWDVISQTVGSTNAGWDNKMFVRADLMPHQIFITNVRIQRLKDISDEDCLKEGLEWDGIASQYYVNYKKETGNKRFLGKTPREAFAHLIDEVSGKGTWDSNPWVWVYDFELFK